MKLLATAAVFFGAIVALYGTTAVESVEARKSTTASFAGKRI